MLWEYRSLWHYVIKFVSDLRQVGVFLLVLWSLVSTTNKTDSHDITEILLKVALNTITLTPNNKVVNQTKASGLLKIKKYNGIYLSYVNRNKLSSQMKYFDIFFNSSTVKYIMVKMESSFFFLIKSKHTI
jgi:hypothetical protein